MLLYHDFSVLGLRLPQRGGIYPANQAAKAPIITGYLLFALGKLKAKGREPITVAELFCADAYYSFLAARFGATRCDAFDSDRDGHLGEAQAVKEALDDRRVHLHVRDVLTLPAEVKASIVLNCGGLYHMADPLRALRISYAMATEYLIVQSVVSRRHTDASYLERPAPGWPHGCRFSAAFLEQAIREQGWRIVDKDENELLGNDRPDDRGSAYYLIAVDPSPA